MYKNPNEPTNYTRMLFAVLLAAVILMVWQSMVEMPRRQKLAALHTEQLKKEALVKAQESTKLAQSADATDKNLTRAQRIAQSARVHFTTPKLQGSIALKGARFDDITLPKYRVVIEKDSPPVTLFSPNGEADSYFVQAGWIAGDTTIVPDQNSVWQADKSSFGAGMPANLSWDNGHGVTFILSVAIDEHYMFTVTQKVENRSGSAIQVTPYAYINRAYDESKAGQHYAILHEGPLGVMEGSLEEISYKDLREKNLRYKDASGWFGITDKYWLSAIIPGDDTFTAQFNHYEKNGEHRYQADFAGASRQIESGKQAESSFRLFAGAKEIQVIDNYAEGNAKHPPIQLFDRAVDFGVLYFLTKPMFLTLNFFFTHTGNFGIAILLLTIVVKLLMFPLANKAYKSTTQMRGLQPHIEKLRDRYGDDAIRMQQEMMALYKRERVNPAAGCLPILIQMPVFFALYKVLFVTIEMRHAPFFGWIHDLSVIDPSNIFTLFGILDWNHPAWLHLGVLPILMCATMVIQMRQQPKPADPVQAKIISYMPYFFLILFATFPAGLVLYWVWNNILSIIQQHVITMKYGKPAPIIKKHEAV